MTGMSAATIKTVKRSLYWDDYYKPRNRTPGAWTLTMLKVDGRGNRFAETHRSPGLRRAEGAAAKTWARGIK